MILRNGSPWSLLGTYFHGLVSARNQSGDHPLLLGLAIPVVIITAMSTLSFVNREGSTWALLGVGLGLVCSILVMTLWLAERSPRAKSAIIPASELFGS